MLLDWGEGGVVRFVFYFFDATVKEIKAEIQMLFYDSSNDFYAHIDVKKSIL